MCFRGVHTRYTCQWRPVQRKWVCSFNFICFMVSAGDRGKHGVRHASTRVYTPGRYFTFWDTHPAHKNKIGIHRIHNCFFLGYAMAERLVGCWLVGVDRPPTNSYSCRGRVSLLELRSLACRHPTNSQPNAPWPQPTRTDGQTTMSFVEGAGSIAGLGLPQILVDRSAS